MNSPFKPKYFSLILISLALPCQLMAEVNHSNGQMNTVGIKQTNESIFVIVEVSDSVLQILDEKRLVVNITTPPVMKSCEVSTSFVSAGIIPPVSSTDTNMLLITCTKNKSNYLADGFRQSYFIDMLVEPSSTKLQCRSRSRRGSECNHTKKQMARIISGQI